MTEPEGTLLRHRRRSRKALASSKGNFGPYSAAASQAVTCFINWGSKVGKDYQGPTSSLYSQDPLDPKRESNMPRDSTVSHGQDGNWTHLTLPSSFHVDFGKATI